MSQLFIFTAAMNEAREHLQDSILNKVPISMLDAALPEEEAAYIKSLLPENDGFYAWGAIPGPVNKRTWEDLTPGDVMLTGYEMRYRFISKVLVKLHNPLLAESIWGVDKNKNTWEYMYLLTKPTPLNVNYDAEPACDYLYKKYQGFSQIKRVDRILKDYPNLSSFLEHAFEVGIPFELESPELTKAEQEAESAGAFDANNILDERVKVFASIVRRRGQPKFRKELLDAYSSACVVTGCTVEAILEAAHIMEYMGDHTNHVTNGLLLRADIHTLFDLGKLRIDSKGRIHLAEELMNSEYSTLDRKKIRLPKDCSKAPSQEALQRKFSQGLAEI